jgi:hypothetical protein
MSVPSLHRTDLPRVHEVRDLLPDPVPVEHSHRRAAVALYG